MVPLYRSDGEWVAVFHQGHVFNADGDWIGFVVGRELFDAQGRYIGFLSNDQRLLRKRSMDSAPPDRQPPRRPLVPSVPISMPLAPMLPDLPYSLIDVFEEFPERFVYVSDTRPDME